MNKKIELKSCPFCGGKSVIGFGSYGMEIVCLSCGSRTAPFTTIDEKSIEEAAQKWNKRVNDK